MGVYDLNQSGKIINPPLTPPLGRGIYSPKEKGRQTVTSAASGFFILYYTLVIKRRKPSTASSAVFKTLCRQREFWFVAKTRLVCGLRKATKGATDAAGFVANVSRVVGHAAAKF